jgi:putative transposase
MKKSKFTDEQVAYTLRQAEGGIPVLEVCRKLGITEQAFYRWKKEYAGMGVAEIRRLRQFEDEKRRLKALVADLTLDKHMLQEVIRKTVKPAQKRPLVEFLMVGFVTGQTWQSHPQFYRKVFKCLEERALSTPS